MVKLKRKRRNKFDILADILQAALKGARKTHLVGEANLNFKLIPQYLETLLEQGLISKTRGFMESRYMYWTTPKGMEFLENYRAIIHAVEGEEE